MRTFILPLLLLLPSLAAAEQAYQPRFARAQTPASILDFSLCPKPEYPRASLRNEETGTVTLTFLIAPTGRPVKAMVSRSSGYRGLDQAALGAMSQCRFRPATVENVPVQTPVRMQYVWTLQ